MKISTNSLWLDTLGKQKTYPPLHKDISVDVAIVGGGLTGITTAYLLSKAGKNVAVLEKGTYADSVTAYTTAFLTQVLDSDLQDLVSMYGDKNAKLLWQSHQQAIDTIEEIIKDEDIQCEFMRCNDYSVAFEEKEARILKEQAKLAKKYGFEVTFSQSLDLGFLTSAVLKVAHQAKFHPMQYLQALKHICVKNGVQLYEQTEVMQIKEHNDMYVVHTKDHTISAKHVITATYDPFNHPTELFGRRGMYTSYIMVATIPAGKLSEGLYEDQENPYHYWRVDKLNSKEDRLIFGGEDHRHELPVDKEKNYRILESFLEKILPDTTYTITHKWDGPILEPSDGIACIGRLHKDKNLYVAMAFSGNGMTYATISAILLTDLILGKKNDWETLYNPTRIPTLGSMLTKLFDYSSELRGGAVKNTFSSK